MLTYPHFEPTFKKEMWSLPRILEHQARVNADRQFLQWTDKNPALSFAEVNRRVNSLAHGLKAMGAGKGTRIVLFTPNSIELVLLWFAANKLGAIEVPINTAYRGTFLEHQVNTCQADMIVVAEDMLDRVIDSLPRMPKLKHVFVWSASGKHGTLPAPAGCRVSPLETLYSGNESDPGVEIGPRDLAAVLFTSGTTGLSKGVEMTHAHLYFFSEETVRLVGLTADDTYMTGFPLFHGNAQFMTLYPCLIVGARCVLYERFSATEWVDRLHATGATVTNSLGVTLPFIFSQPPTPRDKTHKLRRIFAAPTPHDMLDAFKERFGVAQFVEAFGQTETCTAIMTPLGAKRPKGACGVQVEQWFETRIVDPETDEDVPDGEVGELVVRARVPWIMTVGYANMPEKTLESFRNLWFHTGDALRRDSDGWYYFVDRIKDALRRRGENISSFEVEDALRQHEAVAEVAVIAVPAEVAAGEDEVKACVVLKPGRTLTALELVQWAEPRMPSFVVPRYIEFYDALPTTPSEKVRKAELRKDGITANTWDRVKSGYKLKDEIDRDRRKRSS